MTEIEQLELKQEIETCSRDIESYRAAILMLTNNNPTIQILVDAIETASHAKSEAFYKLRELEKAVDDDIFDSPVEGVRNAQN